MIDTSAWPKDVKGISLGGLDHLGIHQKTGALYWDGQEVVTKRTIELNVYERFLATIAASATAGAFLLDLGETFGWWGG
jgi:hypothetical protein